MILIINGPNLNLLGIREPEIYGGESFESYLERLRIEFSDTEIEYFQSNSEGCIIDKLQEYGLRDDCEGIVVNPGGYSHYSVAIADAFSSVDAPVIEVHISNIFSREDYRHRSVTGSKARGMIAGLGIDGYRLALIWLKNNEK